MATVGSYEAKTHLPRLLDRVAAGEEITITRHGVPVARLLPVKDGESADIRAVIDRLRAFRDKHPLSCESIRELIDEGRRY